MSNMLKKCQTDNGGDNCRIPLSGASQVSKHFTTFNLLTLRASNRVSYSTHLANDAIDSKKK